MSEKRFKLSKINPSVNPFDTVYFIIDFENPSNEIRNLKDCCDVLNKQQATINELKEEMVRLHKMSIELMDRVIPNLRRENEQLKNELDFKEQEIRSLMRYRSI